MILDMTTVRSSETNGDAMANNRREHDDELGEEIPVINNNPEHDDEPDK